MKQENIPRHRNVTRGKVALLQRVFRSHLICFDQSGTVVLVHHGDTHLDYFAYNGHFMSSNAFSTGVMILSQVSCGGWIPVQSPIQGLHILMGGFPLAVSFRALNVWMSANASILLLNRPAVPTFNLVKTRGKAVWYNGYSPTVIVRWDIWSGQSVQSPSRASLFL